MMTCLDVGTSGAKRLRRICTRRLKASNKLGNLVPYFSQRECRNTEGILIYITIR